MSCYIVNDNHVGTIVRNYAKHRPLDEHEQQILANLLIYANIKAVNHRYNENTPLLGCDISKWQEMYPGEILALIDCLDYQCCEQPDWENSLAKHQLNEIEKFFVELQGSDERAEGVWAI